MSTFATVVVLAALIFGPAECQQCREFICPGPRCLNQSTICNAVNDCVNGSGLSFSSFDEDRCTGKTFHVRHLTYTVFKMHSFTFVARAM